MRAAVFAVAAFVALLAVAVAPPPFVAAQTVTDRVQAVAVLSGTTARPTAAGLVQFYVRTNVTDAGVTTSTTYTVVVNATGLAPATAHSVHVHTYGDLTDAAGAKVGALWNPTNAAPGCYPAVRPDGALIATFTTDATGNFTGAFVRDRLHFDDVWSMIGRGLVVHNAADDCTTAPDGSAGAVVAQAVVGIANASPSTSFSVNGTGLVYSAVLRPTTLFGANPTGVPVSGRFWFYWNATASTTTVYGRVFGLAAGQAYGLHVHQFGDMTALNDATSAGGHYNPRGQQHALPVEQSQNRHAGDLGNIIAQADGSAYVLVSFPGPAILPMVPPGVQNILGRGLVLHELADQGVSTQATGGAGNRLAMAVIGLTADTALPAPDVAPVSTATVRVYGANDSPLASGFVRLVHDPYRSVTTFQVNVNGLPPDSQVSMHIHNFGDFVSSSDGAATGDHWDPYGWPHACPPTGFREMGDLGSFTVGANGVLWTQFDVDLVTLVGQKSVVGRSLVIWNMPDDCTDPYEPGLGMAAAVGVIGVENRAANTAHNPNSFPAIGGASGRLYTAYMGPTYGNANVGGFVWIEDRGSAGAYVHARFWGFAPRSVHGFHIHMFGDLTGNDGSTAGAHLDFAGNPHRLPSESGPRHMGDLGNVQFDVDGQAYVGALYPGLLAFNGTQNVIGRGVILHADPDQGFAQQSAGLAGARVLMGTIGLSGAAALPPQQLAPKAYAVAQIRPTAGNAVSGLVYFQSGQATTGRNVAISYRLTGLPAGASRGLYIRVNGDVGSADGAAQGAVYNPYNKPLACGGANAAMGMLGNVVADGQGVANGITFVDNLELFWTDSIVGRGLTVGSVSEPCDGSATASQSAAIGHAVIGIARNLDPAYDATSNQRNATDATVLMATMQQTSVTTFGANTTGTVWFRPSRLFAGRVEVYARFQGCIPGKLYGFHVHNYGDWTSSDGGAAGAHWNPFPATSTHALPDETWVQRLAGEMGNILCAADAQVYFNRHFDLMTVGGLNNVVGRGLILHGAVDQGTSQPPLTNFRVCLGIIGLTSQPFPAAYDPAPAASAVAVIKGTVNNPAAAGWVKLTQQPYTATLRVEWSLTGLRLNDGNATMAAIHSMHIHTFGDLSSDDGSAAGLHFNPYGWTHQCYPRGRHVGDLGNIVQDASGNSAGSFTVDITTLFGVGSVLGRAIIIHQYWDDCSNTAQDSDCGNCGYRLAQGVIALASDSATTNFASTIAVTNGAMGHLTGATAGREAMLYVAPTLDDGTVSPLVLVGTVTGFPAGAHNIHVRQYGDTRNGAASQGALHLDLGTVVAGDDGTGRVRIVLATSDLAEFVGRGLFVTATADPDSTPLVFGPVGLGSSRPNVAPTVVNAAPAAAAANGLAVVALTALVAAALARGL